MKKRFTLLVHVLIGGLLIFGCNTEGQLSSDQQNENKAQISDSEYIRVMSFNIRYDNPNDGVNRWENRKDFVANITRLNADIIGIQEALANQLEDLDNLLPIPSFSFDRVGISRDGSDRTGEFCAIYFRTDKFELLAHDTFWLSETPEEPGSIGWDASLPRIVTWAKFQQVGEGDSFYVFNTHFDHRGNEARVNSSRILLNKIDEIAGERPVIVMGDLNALENDDPYKILSEVERGPVQMKLLDGFYHSEQGHVGPNSTWNGFNEIVPDRRIDFIFANPQFRVVKHRILKDTRDGRFPSDHFPVQAEVKLN